MLIKQIDPYGCTCADCWQGDHVAAHNASFSQLSDMLAGLLVNNTGEGFVKTASYDPSGAVVNTIRCMGVDRTWVDIADPAVSVPQTRTRFKRETGPTPPMVEMTSDELVVAILKHAAQISATRDPALRLKLVADCLQPAVGDLLRACVADCRTVDMPWVQVGELVGTSYAVVHRQFAAGGPMLGPASRVSYKKDANEQ